MIRKFTFCSIRTILALGSIAAFTAGGCGDDDDSSSGTFALLEGTEVMMRLAGVQAPEGVSVSYRLGDDLLTEAGDTGTIGVAIEDLHVHGEWNVTVPADMDPDDLMLGFSFVLVSPDDGYEESSEIMAYLELHHDDDDDHGHDDDGHDDDGHDDDGHDDDGHDDDGHDDDGHDDDGHDDDGHDDDGHDDDGHDDDGHDDDGHDDDGHDDDGHDDDGHDDDDDGHGHDDDDDGHGHDDDHEHGDMLIAATDADGGRLVLEYDFAEAPVELEFNQCIDGVGDDCEGGLLLYSTADPGFAPLE